MKTQERRTYTKNCLEFLAYKSVTPDDIDFRIYCGNNKIIPESIDANFNDGFLNNWNWIMEVKNNICQLDIVDEFNVQYCSVAGGYYCSIFPYFKNSFQAFYTKTIDTEKEAVVQIMNEFLTWYKDNKKQ